MKKSRFSVELDPVDTGMLCAQTAACVLLVCESRDAAEAAKFMGEVNDPVAVLLRERMNWADHGFTNALQAHVSLLHDYAQLIVDHPEDFGYLVDRDVRQLMADALSAYQTWKTIHIVQVKLEMNSEIFGDATGFNCMDWTDLNDTLLAPLMAGQEATAS